MQRVVLNLYFIYCVGRELLVAYWFAGGIRFVYYQLYSLDLVEKHQE